MRNPSLKQRLDKETLQRLHGYESLSIVEIAQRFGSYSENVQALMDDYGIPARTSRAKTAKE